MGDRVGVELLFNSVEFGSQSSCQTNSRQLETRCGREATPVRGGPRKTPDGVDHNISRTRKTQRDGHNSGVKICSLCSVSSTLSHANPWTTLSNPCNKLRGEYFSKKVFLRLPSCVFLLASLSCVLYTCVCRLSCVCYHCVGMYPVCICM